MNLYDGLLETKHFIFEQIFKFCIKLMKISLIRNFAYRFPIIKKIWHKASTNFETLNYNEDGIAFKCYKSQWLSLSLRAYEPLTRVILKSLFKRGMVFVDGGANFGLYSILASKIIGSEGQIHAFEPHPEVFQILKSNIKANK